MEWIRIRVSAHVLQAMSEKVPQVQCKEEGRSGSQSSGQWTRESANSNGACPAGPFQLSRDYTHCQRFKQTASALTELGCPPVISNPISRTNVEEPLMWITRRCCMASSTTVPGTAALIVTL
eukprot:6078144-Prymnesium_polylepis.1